jgi:polyisoprenoid-binding protein YceI
MSDTYRIGPQHSRLTVQAFAGGLLSFLGHSPTFAVRDFRGELRWGHDTPEGAALVMAARADSLELTDAIRAADRLEIEPRMRGDVLGAAAHPEARFEATEIVTAPVGDHRYRLGVAGRLTLRGVTNRLAFAAELEHFHDGVRLAGGFAVRLSDYGVPPVTALGGTIRLRDELRLSFDLAAWRAAS